MARYVEAGLFTSKAKSDEPKPDHTTAAVRAIVRGEAAAREAKTARLRAARLGLPTPQSKLPIAKRVRES
jgi:hypothetical protein